MNRATIFISYSHRDSQELALRLFRSLAELDYSVWLDEQRLTAGASWSAEIEEAIDRCEVMLALLSRESFFSPICRAEQIRAIRKNKRIIPLRVHIDAELPLFFDVLHCPFFESQYYAASLDVLLKLLAQGGALPLRGPGRQPPNTAPAPPKILVHRSGQFEALRTAVLAENPAPPLEFVALVGSPGVGKTVLALQMCHDPVVQAAFPDGIIWVTIGLSPARLADKMREVGHALGDMDNDAYNDEKTAHGRLEALLADKTVLLVLDDVWEISQVESFRLKVRRSRILFTTRNRAVALALGTKPVELGVLRREQSLQILGEWAQRQEGGFEEIAKRLGDLPQALTIAGACLLGGMPASRWLAEFKRVRDLRIDPLPSENSARYNLEVCFDLSVKLLRHDQELYYSLGIFPPAAAIPTQVIAKLWRLIDPAKNEPDCAQLLRSMANLCLLNPGPGDSVTLHSLLYQYAREKLADRLPLTHRHLLNGYRSPDQSWLDVPDDGYLRENLAYHLAEAGLKQEFRRLWLDLDWMKKRLCASGAPGLLADLQFMAEDPEIRLVQGAIRLSKRALIEDPNQLAAQLLGRLSPFAGDGIAALLDRAAGEPGVWLRPRAATLISPDGPLRHVLHGHGAGVAAVVVSADDRLVVSGSDDATIKVWDPITGAERGTLGNHRSGVKTLALSGSRVISGSDDCTVKIWDFETGKEQATLAGHAAGVKAVAFSRDGCYAVSGSDDCTGRVWDLRSPTPVAVLKGHSASVRAVCVTADGRHVISGSDDGTLKLWELLSGREVCTMRGHTAGVWGVRPLADNRVLSASWDGTLRIWNLPNWTTGDVLRGHTNGVTCVAVAAGGSPAVSGSGDGTLRVWDLSVLAQVGPPLIGHTSWVRSVALSNSGRECFSASDDGTVRIWDLTRSATSSRPRHQSSVTALLLHDGGRLAISASADSTLKLWNTETASEEATLEGHRARVTAVAISADERSVVSASDDRTLRLWDLNGRREVAKLEAHTDAVNAAAFAGPTGTIISGSSDRTLIVWDPDRHTPVCPLAGHTAKIRSVVCTRDGQRFLSGSADGTLLVWELEGCLAVAQPPLRSGGAGIKSLALLPNRSIAIAGTDDGTLELWDLATRARLHLWNGHRQRVDSLATADDLVVSASSDNHLVIWKISFEGQLAVTPIARFIGDGELFACAATRAGAVIAVGEASGVVHFLTLKEISHRTRTARAQG